MPKSREFINSDSDSGSDDDVPKKKTKTESKGATNNKTGKSTAAASKGAAASNVEKQGDSETMINLGKKKFATVSEFRGTKYVNIREYYGDDGDLKPGKKGIALSVEQWNQLKSSADEIDAALEAI